MDADKPESILFTGDLDVRDTNTDTGHDVGETLDTQVVVQNETYRETIQKNISALYSNANQGNVSGL